MLVVLTALTTFVVLGRRALLALAVLAVAAGLVPFLGGLRGGRAQQGAEQGAKHGAPAAGAAEQTREVVEAGRVHRSSPRCMTESEAMRTARILLRGPPA
jgi:hypothetical protein